MYIGSKATDYPEKPGKAGDKHSDSDGDFVHDGNGWVDQSNGSYVLPTVTIIGSKNGSGSVSDQGSTEVARASDGNSDLNIWGPALLAAGQPIEKLKPVGALGSKPGSSVASYSLSKVLPQKLPVRILGTKVLGRAFGRFVPIVGHSLIIYDAVRSDRMFDPALQGPRNMNQDIDNGKLNISQIKKKYSCFVKGTQVIMSNGLSKNIEDIEIGDQILSVDIKRMTIEIDTVVDIPNTVQEYKEIKAKFSNGVVSFFSPAHPYWVKDKGWSAFDLEEAKKELEFSVKKLKIGDIVLYYNGMELIEVKIKELHPTGRRVEMYNVEYVKNNHSFFANGILVHNKNI